MQIQFFTVIYCITTSMPPSILRQKYDRRYPLYPFIMRQGRGGQALSTGTLSPLLTLLSEITKLGMDGQTRVKISIPRGLLARKYSSDNQRYPSNRYYVNNIDVVRAAIRETLNGQQVKYRIRVKNHVTINKIFQRGSLLRRRTGKYC